MKAVIMAGGKGTRLRPLTSYIPKPMVPILNKPCMEYSIKLLKKYGITEIAVTIQHLPESIKNYFGDGSDWGVRIHYFEEEVPLGTAGSIKNAEEFLDERFIVISGDALTDFDLSEAINFHAEKQSLATLVMTKVDNPLEYGVIMTDDNGRIIRFLEKPSWSEVFSDTVNTGIYILEPEIFGFYERNKEFDFSKDLFPMLLRENKPMYGVAVNGYWSDVGNLEVYRQTQFDILDGQVRVEIEAQETAPGVFVEKGAVIAPEAVIEGPVYIGANSRINGRAKIGSYTVMGCNNHIQSGAVTRSTVIWANNLIGQKAELSGATITDKNRIGDCSILEEGVVIGDACQLGSKTFVKSAVKIWPKKEIRDNTCVDTSLIQGVTLTKNLFSHSEIKGLANIDLTPDFVSRLAAAWGSVLKQGNRIAVAHCAHPYAKLLVNVLSAGLQSTGIHTVRFGQGIAASTRYGIEKLSLNGGIHIGITDAGEQQMVLQFFDHQGLPIDKDFERKIENAYWQENYVRAASDKVGKNEDHYLVPEMYLDAMLAQVNINAVRSSRFTLVMDFNQKNLGAFIHPMLEELGCTVVNLYAGERLDDQEICHLVQRNGAHLGIRLDLNGGKFSFITEKGTPLDRDTLWSLILRVHSYKKSGQLGIPISAPREMEKLAGEWNAKVIRTKETPRSVMEATNGPFYPTCDGIYMLIMVLEYLSMTHQTLSQMIKDLPVLHMQRGTVLCPWKDKGKVMRMMMEYTKGMNIELTDGIKIYDGDAWVLILPDQEKPHFTVVAQAADQEHAAKMVAHYSECIRKFQSNHILGNLLGDQQLESIQQLS